MMSCFQSPGSASLRCAFIIAFIAVSIALSVLHTSVGCLGPRRGLFDEPATTLTGPICDTVSASQPVSCHLGSHCRSNVGLMLALSNKVQHLADLYLALLEDRARNAAWAAIC